MRKTKKFKLDDKEVEVRELTVRQIIGIMDRDNDQSMHAMLETFAELAISMPVEELLDLAPSELQTIWDNFQEVNASFFGLARALGLTEKVTTTLQRFLSEEFAVSSVQAMDRQSGTTDGPSS